MSNEGVTVVEDTAQAAGSATASAPDGVPDGTAVVEIWTDGGCKLNPGPGGWAALLCYRGQERELSGGEAETTNNRMELTAAAEALEALKRPCRVVLHTDSEYVRNGITRWSTGWVRRKWRNASGDPVANMDLWRRLLEISARHEIEWKWVRGHSGNVNNERVDQMATAARDALGIAYPRRTRK
ncbi:ribonuclease HI [Komagataeibacter rhaeticus]|nr:ribonuclease HI [Komagataeibacter rhaeticus]